MSTEIVVTTKYDVLTRPSSSVLIAYCFDHLRDEPNLVEVMLDLADGHMPLGLEDVVQYAIDFLNDDNPYPDMWYYLTADANLALDTETGDE